MKSKKTSMPIHEKKVANTALSGNKHDRASSKLAASHMTGAGKTPGTFKGPRPNNVNILKPSPTPTWKPSNGSFK